MHSLDTTESGFQPSERWKQIRDTIADRTLSLFIILLVLGLPVSIWRVSSIGWNLTYTLHIIFAAVGIAIYLLRHKLPFTAKLLFNIFSFGLIGTMGVISLGLSSNGFLLILLMNFFVATTCSQKTTILSTTLTLLIIAIIGIAFSTGLLHATIDTNRLMADSASWIGRWFTLGFLLLITVSYIIVLQKNTLALLEEVQAKHMEISHIANHDQLTGLPLMRLARDRFNMMSQHAKRNDKKIAVLFIDLDGFKSINDSYGHEAGDYVLQSSAKRIADILRQADTIARISGDEFLVILGELSDNQAASTIAEKLIAEISQPLHHNNTSLSVGASIGIAIYPDDDTDFDSLKRQADKAMYNVKKTGKNNYAFARIEKKGGDNSPPSAQTQQLNELSKLFE